MHVHLNLTILIVPHKKNESKVNNQFMVLILNILFVLIYFVLYSINGFFPLIITFIIMALIIILRIRKVVLGTKVNTKKTIIFSVYFIAIASFLVYNSFLIGGIPFVYIVLYFAIAVAAVDCSYIYSKRALSFWELPTSNSNSTVTYTKGGLSIYIVYIVALSIRIMINFLFIGSDKLYFNNNQALANDTTSAVLIMPPLLGANSTTTLFAFIATDILLIIGAGLVVGRNVRIIKHQYEYKKDKP